ncbi:MAG: FkbM family methyltransferase [Pseudomonadota bacterium]
MPTDTEAEIKQQIADGYKAVSDGQSSMMQGHQALAQARNSVSHAATRGQINQKIWTCEQLTGQRAQFFSQSGQDAFLDRSVFNGKRGGTFVEIGGYDGITGSNCLFFELIRGWSGLLIEPSPMFISQAQSFRRATCLQCAVADREGTAEFLEVQKGFSQMSGLTGSYDPGLRKQVEDDPRHQGELIEVQTRTLHDILDEHMLRVIDYISLDVEGGEMSILSGFPFEKYDITAWTIENNTHKTEIPGLMQAKGYRRVEALGVDEVYVKS